jgi:hypothetical protein
VNNDQLKRRLHTDPDPYEAAYRGRPLPVSLNAPTPRSSLLSVAVTALAGAAAAVALMAVIGTSGFGLFAKSDAGLGPEAGERPCRSSDFAVRSEPWAGAPMAGGVLVIFQANETAWCHIQHGIHASVLDATAASNAEAAVGLREPIVVAPGQAWQSGVYWSTYCGTAGGTVAAPEHPARPLQLSVAIAIEGEPMDGVPTVTGDTLLPVAIDGEIAPEPCDDDFPGTPFWLGLTGLDPYPGPAPTVVGP